MTVSRYKKRFWAVYAPGEELICICVYKKGAENVARLLQEHNPPSHRREAAAGGTSCS
jgi:hypothetical protein